MIAVLDATVALKWQFEDEEVTSAAMALLEDFIDLFLGIIDNLQVVSADAIPFQHGELRVVPVSLFAFTETVTELVNLIVAGCQQTLHMQFRRGYSQ
jgi:hypothetical protein